MSEYDYQDLTSVLHSILSPKPSDFYNEAWDDEAWNDEAWDAIPDPAPDDHDDDIEW